MSLTEFVNIGALVAAITSAIATELPSKVAAEPTFLSVAAVPLIIAAAVWLALAILRNWSVNR